MQNSNWLTFLTTLVWAVPYLMIYVIGIVLALVFWSRHPTASLQCVIAFLMLLGSTFVASGMQFWLIQAHERGTSGQQIGTIMGIASLFHVIIHLIAWTLLLVAMFRRRPVRDEKQAC